MKDKSKDQAKKMSQVQQAMFTKEQLVKMNNGDMGHNWIRNIDNIGENQKAILYSTDDACWMSGRIYVALPTTLKITEEVVQKYKLWL